MFAHIKFAWKITFTFIFAALFFFIHGILPFVPVPEPYNLESIRLWIETIKIRKKTSNTKILLTELTDKHGNVRMALCEREEK